MDECFLPPLLAVVESKDGEAEFPRSGNGCSYVSDLERQVVESLSVLFEIPVEEVVLVVNDGADHLKSALAREVELDPFEVFVIAEAATDVRSPKEIHERLGNLYVVNSDRNMIEAFDDVMKPFVRRLDISHDGAIPRADHCGT